MMHKIIFAVITITMLIISYSYFMKKGVIIRTGLIVFTCVGGLLFIYKVFTSVPDYNDYYCTVYSHYKVTPINREVIVKKINLLHMMRNLIVLKRVEDDKIDTIYLSMDQSNSYNEINEGDTLVKKENNDSLFILKNGVPTFINRVNCGCDTNQYLKKHDILQK